MIFKIGGYSMKQDLFIVVFTNHCIEQVWAWGITEAIILAKARQINKGNSYMVSFVKNDKNEIISANIV